MPQPETLFKNKVLRRLKEIDGLWYVKVQQVSVRGIPDILICYRGRFIAWELKVGANKVKRKSLQAYNLALIKEAGGISMEVSPANFDKAMEALACLSYNDLNLPLPNPIPS